MPEVDDARAVCRLFNQIRIRDIMTTPVPTVDDQVEMSDVLERFITEGATHVCVVDQSGKLIGVVSQKYLYKARSPRKMVPGQTIDADDRSVLIDGDSIFDRDSLNDYILTDIMQTIFTAMSPDDSVAKAVITMSRMNIDFVPVVDGERKVVGLLREKNMVKLLNNLINK